MSIEFIISLSGW